MPCAKITDVIAALKAGRMVVLVDDEDRENERDLVCAAEFITSETVNFMLREARGLLCVALTPEECDRLQLYPQATTNTRSLGRPSRFPLMRTPGLESQRGSRLPSPTTIKLLIDPHTVPGDLSRPGHIFQLRAGQAACLSARANGRVGGSLPSGGFKTGGGDY